MTQRAFNIAIIGAGPASLYAADTLSKAGHHITIINRDIKPGGLIEYGIYLNKYKMKSGLRKVYNRTLEHAQVDYIGHVAVGEGGALTLEELRALGFDAIVVAVGAQGTKWLGLPNEDAPGVYHAKDVVYHYNGLPPFSERDFAIGQDVCVVGFGNVSLDIVHWLVCEKKVAQATIVARRGPAERASTPKELKLVSGALDLAQIEAEITDRIAENLRELGQDPAAELASITEFKDAALETESPTSLKMRFLRSPAGVELDEQGRVIGLRCDVMRMTPPKEEGGRPGVKATGESEVIPCDSIVFAIGDSIEPSIGLPLEPKWKSTFAVVPEPWEGAPEAPRYMVYDPQTQTPLWGTFVIGWARKASDGLVGKAKQDADQGCVEILAYLNGELGHGPEQAPTSLGAPAQALKTLLHERDHQFVELEGVRRIEAAEQALAKSRGLPEAKLASTQKMLEIAKG